VHVFLVFSDRLSVSVTWFLIFLKLNNFFFNVLILKINLKNKKNIILIYFQTKNILKNNRY
jgi:hypothetical protein